MEAAELHRVLLLQQLALGECFSDQYPRRFFSEASVGPREFCVELLILRAVQGILEMVLQDVASRRHKLVPW
jgi:hypothetical protein